MNWLLASHNSVFAAAFILLLCFAVLEGISMLLGLGISEFLTDLIGLPDGADAPADVDISADPGLDADADASGDSHSPGAVLSWLEIGKVPALISLCSFLGAFGISGMFIQEVLSFVRVGPLPQLPVAAFAFVVALPLLKFSNRLLGKLWPNDETSAFSPSLLIGRVGTVTIGSATSSRAAEVRVTGPDGRSHYVMSFATGDPVPQGAELHLQSRDAATGHFRGTLNTNPDLSPKLFS